LKPASSPLRGSGLKDTSHKQQSTAQKFHKLKRQRTNSLLPYWSVSLLISGILAKMARRPFGFSRLASRRTCQRRATQRRTLASASSVALVLAPHNLAHRRRCILPTHGLSVTAQKLRCLRSTPHWLISARCQAKKLAFFNHISVTAYALSY